MKKKKSTKLASTKKDKTKTELHISHVKSDNGSWKLKKKYVRVSYE